MRENTPKEIECIGGKCYIKGTNITPRQVYDTLDFDGDLQLELLAEDWNVSTKDLEVAIDFYEENREEIRSKREEELSYL